MNTERTARRLMVTVTLALVFGCTGTSDRTPQPTVQTTTTLTDAVNTASTQATTTTTTSTTTSTTTTTIPTIVLRHDGLGVVSFGDPVDTVMEVLTAVLGPPSWDEIQQSPDVDRSVAWGGEGEEVLYLQFTYWDYFARDGTAPEPPEPMPEGPVFHYYLTKSSQFATDADITIDSPVGDLAAVYPGLRTGEGCGDPGKVEFWVDPPEPEVWLNLPIFGLLDGELDEPGTRIVYIGAGWDRSPC